MLPCYIFTARYFVVILYRDYIACIMCSNSDRLETVIVYVLIKFCSVLFCSVHIQNIDLLKYQTAKCSLTFYQYHSFTLDQFRNIFFMVVLSDGRPSCIFTS